ncbi:uncharacterized protein LOC129314190 [Prosopis cineraria]|uniref:uncharacterized protein LOC129314190 n=1 Tax=Prosopis cineraria TaxID=364024 RepID=UPI00240F5D6F|nr:uncharacterized protein LOC129314190 [Prosopis cineraria]
MGDGNGDAQEYKSGETCSESLINIHDALEDDCEFDLVRQDVPDDIIEIPLSSLHVQKDESEVVIETESESELEGESKSESNGEGERQGECDDDGESEREEEDNLRQEVEGELEKAIEKDNLRQEVQGELEKAIEEDNLRQEENDLSRENDFDQVHIDISEEDNDVIKGSREDEGEKSQEEEDDDEGIDSERKNEDDKTEEEGDKELVDEGTTFEGKNEDDKFEEEEHNEEGAKRKEKGDNDNSEEEEDKEEVVGGKDSDEDEGGKGEEQSSKHLRRSKRDKRPAVKSPWVRTNVGKKRKMDDKERLFEICTTPCEEDEGDKIIIDLYGYYLTRAELQCFGGKRWISDRVMSMVAQTLAVDDNKGEIFPEFVRYNIADYEFIFSPTLFHSHWFYFVFEIKTMNFYVLDSLRNCFYSLLCAIEPQLFEDDVSTDIIWAKVHVQIDTYKKLLTTWR